MPCRECNDPRSRWRGLCKVCYADPAIRAKWPKLSTAGRALPKRGNFARNLYGLKRRAAPIPTTAEPGSELKIAVLAARFQARQELWHADDAKLPDGPCAIAAGDEFGVGFGDA